MSPRLTTFFACLGLRKIFRQHSLSQPICGNPPSCIVPRTISSTSTSGLFEIIGHEAQLIKRGRFYSLIPLENDLVLTSNQKGMVLLLDTSGSKIKTINGPEFPFEVRYQYLIDSKTVLVAGWMRRLRFALAGMQSLITAASSVVVSTAPSRAASLMAPAMRVA